MTSMILRRFQFSPNCKRNRWRYGWTLVELMVTLAVGAVILAALVPTIAFVSKSFIAVGNYTDLDRASRITLDTLSRDIRNAALLVAYTTNSITLENQDGTYIRYAWNPSTGHFRRTDDAGTKVLLTDCDALVFNLYQQNPTNNFEFAAATTINQTKLINVSWRCSRYILGTILNSESVQTAEVVIRN